MSKLIPRAKMEEVYAKYFSEVGRRGKDSRLITELMIIKHRKGYSDRELIEQFLENPYLQYFCGYDHFVRKGEIHYSTLSKARKRLGVEYFKEFEKELLEVLVREKIIKPRNSDVRCDSMCGEYKLSYGYQITECSSGMAV